MNHRSGRQQAVLTEPIVNRYKRRKLGKRFWLTLVVLCLSAVGLMLLRVWLLLGFPWVESQVVDAEDGLQSLRGVVGMKSPEEDAGNWLKEQIDKAFAAKLDFFTVLVSTPESLQSIARDAPMAVLVGQSVRHESGGEGALYGLRDPVGPDEKASPSLFRIVRHLGGWGVLNPQAYPDDGGRQWRGREPDVVQILPAAQAGPSSIGDGLIRRLGSWFDGRAAWLHLARRPTAQLAAWAAIGRGRHTLGLCGFPPGEAGRLDAPGQWMTYLLVRKGFGPYGPAEVEATLRAGHHFCALSALGEPSGFRFSVREKKSGRILAMMGDEFTLPAEEVELEVDLGFRGGFEGLNVVLLVDGSEVARSTETVFRHPVRRGGAYRVEVGLLGGDFPWGESERIWIYSNPILINEG